MAQENSTQSNNENNTNPDPSLMDGQVSGHLSRNNPYKSGKERSVDGLSWTQQGPDGQGNDEKTRFGFKSVLSSFSNTATDLLSRLRRKKGTEKNLKNKGNAQAKFNKRPVSRPKKDRPPVVGKNKQKPQEEKKQKNGSVIKKLFVLAAASLAVMSAAQSVMTTKTNMLYAMKQASDVITGHNDLKANSPEAVVRAFAEPYPGDFKSRVAEVFNIVPPAPIKSDLVEAINILEEHPFDFRNETRIKEGKGTFVFVHKDAKGNKTAILDSLAVLRMPLTRPADTAKFAEEVIAVADEMEQDGKKRGKAPSVKRYKPGFSRPLKKIAQFFEKLGY